jgi:NADH-quinone oxidoreductase subunit G
LISEAENLVVIYGSDGLGLEGSLELSTACASLLEKSGKAEKDNSGLLPIWQKANDQGAWDIGYRPVEHLEHVFSTADALYIAGADPAGDDPIYAAAIAESKFVIVQELFLTETAKLADVVFPAQSILEREGTFTNGMRRVQRFLPVLEKVSGARADFQITADVRQRVTHSNLGMGSAGQMFMVMAAHLPDYNDLSYAKLAETVPQRPIIGRSDLYYGGTAYDNRQGLGKQLSTSASRREKYGLPELAISDNQIPDPEKNEVLLAVPITLLYDRGAVIEKTKLLNQRTPAGFILLHPATSEKKGLVDGEMAAITINGTDYPVMIKVDDSVSTSHVMVPSSLGIPLVHPSLVKVHR